MSCRFKWSSVSPVLGKVWIFLCLHTWETRNKILAKWSWHLFAGCHHTRTQPHGTLNTDPCVLLHLISTTHCGHSRDLIENDWFSDRLPRQGHHVSQLDLFPGSDRGTRLAAARTHSRAMYDFVQLESIEHFINCTTIDDDEACILESLTLPFWYNLFYICTCQQCFYPCLRTWRVHVCEFFIFHVYVI